MDLEVHSHFCTDFQVRMFSAVREVEMLSDLWREDVECIIHNWYKTHHLDLEQKRFQRGGYHAATRNERKN